MNSGIVALRKLSGAVLNNIFEFQFVLVGPATSATRFLLNPYQALIAP